MVWPWGLFASDVMVTSSPVSVPLEAEPEL